jgi:hypothetical protein
MGAAEPPDRRDERNAEIHKARRLMNILNFQLAHERLAAHAGGTPRRARQAPLKLVHRPSVALILLATTVQIIAMAALLGTAASAFQ